jgi:hypothetical protein
LNKAPRLRLALVWRLTKSFIHSIRKVLFPLCH